MPSCAIAAGLGLALSLCWLAACGGDDDESAPATCEELAAIIGECRGGGLAEVEFRATVCDRFVLSSECLAEWAAAGCAEDEDEEPSYLATCSPPCSDDPPACQGDDALRVCEDGAELVYRCEAICGASELSFTGTCGDEFDGMPSMSGEDICWCE
jgi:hypothetical protein